MFAAFKIVFICMALIGAMAWALYAIAAVSTAKRKVRRGSHRVGGVWLP
jgi:hypothetical protein